MIRVLVADDSATARALLVGMLSAEAEIEVVGEARTGREAVQKAIDLTPDLITMDVQMPELDGLEATREIMMHTPRPIIIVSATARAAQVELSLDATRAGALMVLPKPEGPGSVNFLADRRQLISMVRAMAGVKVVRRHSARPDALAARRQARSQRSGGAPGSPIRLVAIAASTGGPAAVRDILAALPRGFPVPIFVTQHIAHGFTSGLVHWLAGDTRLSVKLATLGEQAEAGTVYVAPEQKHLGCRVDDAGTVRILLDQSPPIGAFRPSATWMFRSCAEAVGGGLVSVILTGMGDDGVLGLRVARERGGIIIAQDEATSVIYGMPREAVRSGVVDDVLPLTDVAARLVELTR